ncbi:MAG: Gfo/Idh/MocA family oxidoreductase [Acidimicrobiales bacterium]
MTNKLKVGVVGAGVIGQVMHLHFLRELHERYEIAAICDLSKDTATACAQYYDIPSVFTDWGDMLKEPLDAVLVLTSGSHAPIAIEAAHAGMHVFVEKPMCFSALEGVEMIAAADEAEVALMVGYPKRYDPAFFRFVEETGGLLGKKLLRVTTTESPFLPYVRHYPLFPPASDIPKGVLAKLAKDSEDRLKAAIGTDDKFLLRQYQAVLLDTLVHEINTVRGVLGEPLSLDYVDLREGHATVLLGYDGPTAAIHWLDTPDMTRYSMEFSMHAENGRVTLTFPSPYLRNAPTMLAVEHGNPEDVESYSREDVSSYESGFKEELRTFYDAVTSGGPIATEGADAVKDIALCQAIIRCAIERAPIMNPTGA